MSYSVIKKSTLLSDILLVLGVIAIAAPLIWSMRADYLQSQAAFQTVANTTVQSMGVVPSKIYIPKLNMSAVIIEETSPSDLDRGPMHLAGTVFPGRPGNCCIAAHKEKWFKGLGKLDHGDTVIISADDKRYIYTVTGQKIVRSTDVWVLEDTASPAITLITCTGPAYFGRGKGRLIVTGVLKSAE